MRWQGEGVHVVTVNEYLTERDATEMGELYSWLGFQLVLTWLPNLQLRREKSMLVTSPTNEPEIG